MPWSNPNSPNEPDFYLFLQEGMGIPASALPAPTVAAAPAVPVLTPGAGGALPSGTVYVVITYVSAFGETLASVEASAAVGANGSVAVTSPAAAAFATGYNVYAAMVTGGETLQSASPVPIGTAFQLTALGASTAVPPTVNTTGWTWPMYAFNRASALVLSIPTVAGIDYTLAVYNCAGHLLLGTAPDQTGQTYFATTRATFDMNAFTAGVINSSSDQSTSNSMTIPENLQNLTVGDLWFLKTPYGRAYMAYAMDFGQVAGLT